MAITNTDEYVSDHTLDAISQLLEQFTDSVKLQAWIKAYTDRIQEIEDALDPVISAREISNATGHRLDGLGAIVGEPRRGRTDNQYRVYIQVRILVNKSSGTINELIKIVQLIASQATPDVAVDEYSPKTIYIRARNHIESYPLETAQLLNEAKPAGTKLVYIYSTTETNDDDVFRYSDTVDTPETTSDQGFGNGTYCGV